MGGEPLRSARFTLRWTAPVFFSGPRFDPSLAIWHKDRRDGTALIRAVGPDPSDPEAALCLLRPGAVAVRTPVGAGGDLHPGDFFGEMSLLDGEPRSATIVATTPLRLLVVDRSHFWRLLEETPDLVGRILMILSRRVRRLEQTVDAILRGTNPS